MDVKNIRIHLTRMQLGIAVIVLTVLMSLVLPAIMQFRRSANEVSAVAALRQLLSVEGTWRATDSDRNGIMDYWTADVCGFYAVMDALNCPLKYINMDFAKADYCKVINRPLNPGSAEIPLAPMKGYFFQALKTDEAGADYRAYPDEEKLIWDVAPNSKYGPRCNTKKYGFKAFPAKYGSSGIRTFIVNETGQVYGKDLSNKDALALDQFPVADPRKSGWAVAD